MSDSHKKQIEHDAASRHAAGRHGASTGKHVAAHASNDAGDHGPSRRTLAIALPIAGALVAGGIALVHGGQLRAIGLVEGGRVRMETVFPQGVEGARR